MNIRDLWRTPSGVWLAPLRLCDLPYYDVDAASDFDAGVTVPCINRITQEMDAFKVMWGSPGDTIWLNPPFSKDGGGKVAWVERALYMAAKGRNIAFYAPVYGDRYADILEAKCTGTIRIGGGRVRHVPPEGVKASSPPQHAHRIWLLGPDWPRCREVWDWKQEKWIT
jgi:hypothetical protein